MKHQSIFNLAMDLMDERTAATGISAKDTADYKAKAPGLLTILQSEVARYEGVTPVEVASLDDTVAVSDGSALTVLPYGLAAHLLLADGDQDMASYFSQRFEEAKRARPATITDITDVYGGIESESGW